MISWVVSLFAHKDVPGSAAPVSSLSPCRVRLSMVARWPCIQCERCYPGVALMGLCSLSHTTVSVHIGPSHREDVSHCAPRDIIVYYQHTHIMEHWTEIRTENILHSIRARKYLWSCLPRRQATAWLLPSQTLPEFLSEPRPSSEMWREDHWGLVAAKLCQKNGYQVCQHHNQSPVWNSGLEIIVSLCIVRFGEWLRATMCKYIWSWYSWDEYSLR